MAFLLRKLLKRPPISLSPSSPSSSLLRFLSSQTPPPSPSPNPLPLRILPVPNANQHQRDPQWTDPVDRFLRLIIHKGEGISYPCLAQLVEVGENGNGEIGSSEDGRMVWADSVKRKRKRKMNKHKYKKRRKLLSRKT